MPETPHDEFVIDRELNGSGLTKGELVKLVMKELDGVEKGHYLLINIDDFGCVAEIAKAVVFKKAAVDTVLKKGANRWAVMIKNDVPVAQLDRA